MPFRAEPGDEPRPIHTARSRRFAHVGGEVLVHGEEAIKRLGVVLGGDGDLPPRWPVEELAGDWLLVRRVPDPVAVVEHLRSHGLVAQPNHVFFAHGCGAPCGPHPAFGYRLVGNPLAANPLAANPLAANPLAANPLAANPLAANPLAANPLAANVELRNTAIPAPERRFPKRSLDMGTLPTIAIIDTGIPDPANLPSLLKTPGTTAHITGGVDAPDVDLEGWDGVMRDADGFLDPVAGHGTFIAGLVEQLAPGCRIHAPRVISPFGDANESDIVTAINALVGGKDAGLAGKPDIIGLSLGGPVMETPFLLRGAIAAARQQGIVVVASAGNAATCHPQYPAALETVVAVGALGPDGPAPWTNYGDWVDACAPGTDLVSSFFASFDGNFPMQNTVDEDRFHEWATWSGTSFAVPVVIAALAREMAIGKCSAPDAVDRVVYAPHLPRIPCLGTIVTT